MTDSHSKDLLFFFGKSQIGELARKINWNTHPLGPVDSWSRELKTAISIVVGSKLPMFISWGKERHLFYNDSYAVILGQKHPRAFGDKFPNVWSDIWKDIEPLVLSVDRGEAVYLEDLKLIMNRHGSEEETYFTFSYSPLLSDTGKIEGLYCAVVETTGRKKAEDALKAEQLKLKTVFAQAPYPIALLEGSEHRFVFANSRYVSYFLGGKEQIGKTVLETIPDAATQGFIALLDKVYQTGERFVGNEVKFLFTGPDKIQKKFYLNFVYEPVRDGQGNIEGILAAISDVTSTVESRKKIEESEARLAFALEGARMGLWSMDLATNKISHSNSARKLLGFDLSYNNPDEAINTLIHPNDRERVARVFVASVKSGEAYKDEYRTITPEGDVLWIQARGHLRLDDEGQPVDMIGTVMDITEEKNAHDLIKASEARLQTLAETIPQMAWRTDSVGYAYYFNLNWLKKTGTKLEDNIGTGWTNFVHPDDRAKAIEDWNLAVSGKAEYNTEYRVKMLNGDYRWHIARGVPILDQSGKIIEWIGTTTDVDDQKRARIEYERSVDVSPAILWITGVDGSCSYLSKKWYDFTGQTEAEALGFGWLDATHPDDKKRTEEIYVNANSAQKPFYAEYRLKTKSGDYRWAIDAGNPRYDQDGKYIGYAGTVFDIHDLKIFEEELKDALKARDEFLSIASHELKTPLTSLKIQAQLHQRLVKKNDPGAYSPENVNRIVQLTEKQVSHLTRLVDDMLDVSRIRSGNLNVIREEFDLCDLTKEVIERLKGQFENIAVPLPEVTPCQNTRGNWDKLRLEQVITNLLTNAIRYGKKKPVTVRVEGQNQLVRLTVTDQGIGIAEGAKEKIFDRFERSVDPNEVSGLGLGLFITKQIVKAHNGKVWVESELGKGSTFIVEIPKEEGLS